MTFRRSLRALLPLLVGLALPAAAAPARFADPGSLAATERQGRVEAQARADIEALFARLCPGRCELLEVAAQVGEPSAADALSPGFEPVTPGGYAVEVRRLQTTVLLDGRLPPDFRRNIPRLIRYRLEPLAQVVEVRREVLDFPEPQAEPAPPPLETPLPAPAPRPAPLPLPAAPTPDAEPDAAAEPPGLPWSVHLAWVAPLVLTLVLAGLLLMLVRRLLDRLDRGPGARDAGAPPPEGEAAGESGGAPDAAALRRRLAASRALRNRFLRRWLQEDPAGLAVLVRLLGTDLLSDLRRDPALAAPLAALADHLGRAHDAPSPEATRRVLAMAEARLEAARVTAGDEAEAWAFLEGVTAPALDRALRGFEPEARAEVLVHLPSGLRGAWLERLPDGGRRDLLLAAATREPLDREAAEDLAARVKQEVDRVDPSGGDGRAEALVELLDTLEPADQTALLRELDARRPDVARAVLSRTVLEEALPSAPDEVLVEALHRLPVETLVRFLRGAEPQLSTRLRALVPAGRRSAVETELALEIPVLRTDLAEARRTFARTVREVYLANGEDPAQLNLGVLLGEGDRLGMAG